MHAAAASYSAASMDDADLAHLLLDWDDAEISLLTGNAAVLSAEPLLGWIDPQSPKEAATHDEATDDSGELNPSETTAKTISRSSLCRQRQRGELQRLRRDAAELEDELRHLQAGNRASIVAPRGGMWQRIAQYHHQQRRKAGIENEKLHQLIREHRKIARRLEKVFHACRALQATCEPELHHSMQSCSSVSREPTTFPFSRADTLIETDQDYEHITLKSNGGPTMLEVAFCKVYSGNFAQRSADFWHSYCSDHYPVAGGNYSSMNTSSSGVIGSVEIPLHIHGRTVLVASRFRIRYVEESSDRAVILWEDLSDEPSPHELEDSPVERVQLKTNASLCVESLRCGANPASVARLYSLSMPSAHSSIDDPIRAMTAELVAVVQASTDRLCQRLEIFLQQ